MDTMTPRERIDKARNTNNARDYLERDAGFAPPDTGPLDLTLRTIMCAVHAGLVLEDLDCVAEAYEMLIDLHMKMTGIRFDPARSKPTKDNNA